MFKLKMKFVNKKATEQVKYNSDKVGGSDICDNTKYYADSDS